MPLEFSAPPEVEQRQTEFVNLADYANHFVILVPMEEREDETKFGIKPTIYASGMAWVDGEIEALGDDLRIRWQAVVEQLRPKVGTGEAVAGRIVRRGRMYVLEDDPTTAKKVQAYYNAQTKTAGKKGDPDSF